MTNLINLRCLSLPRRVPRSVARCTRRFLRIASDQNGNSLIETAIALPLFLMIFLGFSQYAIVLLTYCNATYACRMASRYASMHSNSSLAPDTVAQIQGMVTSNLFINPAITPAVTVKYYTSQLVLCPDPNTQCNIPGDVVQVGVNWSQTLKLGFNKPNGTLAPQTFSIGTQNYKVITR